MPPTAAPYPSSGYRPPLAPHGPYASSSPYAASLGYANRPVAPYPGLGPTAPVRPKRPRERSKLGRLTLSVMCLALAVVVVVDVGAHLPVSDDVYVAVALAVIGLGLLVGAWFGRARWLILLGVVGTIALAGTVAVDTVGPDFSGPRDVSITPAALDELDSAYQTQLGDVYVDLSKLDFDDQSHSLYVGVDLAGSITVVLPKDVDANVTVDSQTGSTMLFGREYRGQTAVVTDTGTDGPGDGQLDLHIQMGVGNVEVRR
jgi:hypothetical protein